MNSKIQDCINGGFVHSAIGISRDSEYKGFSQNDFIKLIDFLYEHYLHAESELEDLKEE